MPLTPPQPGDTVTLGITDVQRILGHAQPTVKVSVTHYQAAMPYFEVERTVELAWFFAGLLAPWRFLLEDEGRTWSRPI